MTAKVCVLVVFWILFGASMVFWRQCTAKFLRENGENADFVIPTFFLSIAGDFVKAIRVGRSSPGQVPIGVYFHGLLFAASIGVLLVASRWYLFEG